MGITTHVVVNVLVWVGIAGIVALVARYKLKRESKKPMATYNKHRKQP